MTMAGRLSTEIPLGLDRVLGWVDRLSTFAGWTAGLALLGLLVLMLSEVFARNLLGVSIPIAWDYSAYLMGTVFFLAAAGALRHGIHVRVTLLNEALPQSIASKVKLLAAILAFAIACYVCFALGDQTYQSFKRGAKSFSVVATPLWIPQLVFLTGSVIFAFQLMVHAIRIGFGAEAETRTADQI
ncbi:MAG: TRAP transporter small permease [Hyphomicrobiales bacterium]|nr:TRAP transporter small permease [Hyphomicrobiales bacterium]